MKLLHIDSSILGSNSVSRSLSAAVVDRLKAEIPGLEVTYRDLAAEPITHLSGAYFMSKNTGAPGDGALKQELQLGAQVLEEFLDADIVVIGVAFYNFTIPSQLKAWIDRIIVAGKTFRYADGKPQGLASDKRVILAITRGGLYGPGLPGEAAEHAETYLRAIFAFIGVTEPEIIVAEGLAIGAEHREASVKRAMGAISELRV